MSEEQHDDHCLMNVDWKPWRIQWIHNQQMCVAYGETTRVADLTKINWGIYCLNATYYFAAENERQAEKIEAQRRVRARKREEALTLRERYAMAREPVPTDRLLASGYGPIDDLEDEVILVDLEFTDPEPILVVDCQTTHLERLAP